MWERRPAANKHAAVLECSRPATPWMEEVGLRLERQPEAAPTSERRGFAGLLVGERAREHAFEVTACSALSSEDA